MVRIFAAFSLFLGLQLYSKEIPHPYQILVSHIEPKGIGYKEGYTSLAFFFAWPQGSDWTIFGDARGHVFNQGKFAVNGGLGARYQGTSRLYGVSSYYDFRQNHANYNQVSLGLESLGKRWDFRINGYLPVGTIDGTYDTTFVGVRNNRLIFSKKQEFALGCIQTEAEIHLDEISVPCSFSIGPYWLNGQNTNAWGGEVRFMMNFSDYVWIEGNASYDNLFKWIGQGRLGVIVPFGPRKKDSDPNKTQLKKLSLKRVNRREIIPLDRKKFTKPAIDPKTGEPYFF